MFENAPCDTDMVDLFVFLCWIQIQDLVCVLLLNCTPAPQLHPSSHTPGVCFLKQPFPKPFKPTFTRILSLVG